MKLFVTGGAGFIGSNFIRHVLGLHKAYSVVNYDKLTYAGNLGNLESVANDSHYRFVRDDICDPAAAESAMRDCDAVIHFAAESHVDRSIYDPSSPAIPKAKASSSTAGRGANGHSGSPSRGPGTARRSRWSRTSTTPTARRTERPGGCAVRAPARLRERARMSSVRRASGRRGASCGSPTR